MQVPVVFCADANYGKYLTVAIQSIIENSSPEHEYHIIIFDGGLDKQDLAVIERQIAQYRHFNLRTENIVVWLNKQQHIAAKSNWNRSIYGRLLVPELCPHDDKVIYADADIIFNRDIAELMQIDLGDAYIAASIAITKEIYRALDDKRTISFIKNTLGMADNQPYINSGLMIYNIKAWKKHNLVDKALQFLSANKTRFPDQDAINAICREHIYYIPQYWNCLMRIEHKWRKLAEDHKKNKRIQTLFDEWLNAYNRKDNVIHFIGLKPWSSLFAPKSDIWWHYAAKTEIHDRLLADTVAFNKQAELLHMGEPLTYRLLGLPLFSMRAWPNKKKYYFGKMRARHLMEIRFDRRTGYLAFYLFELKIFGRQSSA